MPAHLTVSVCTMVVFGAAACCLAAEAAGLPREKSHTNLLGMELVRIPAGSFLMGEDKGHLDQRPRHKVTISRAFYMGATEVTNAQYERFDPAHRKLRGKRGLSKEDDEAVVYVSWHEASAFCKWLSKKERKPYRLPTEAEWEYACRAGTTTAYHTGGRLPKVHHRCQKHTWNPVPVSLKVGTTPPNAWGLHEMHGNVEEWCFDWFGPYEAGEQTDPVGRADGTFKVTRGGSHNTPVRYLRSAARLGTLPQDKHWLIGFRVVLGKLPKTPPLPEPPAKLWARDVKQAPCDWSNGPPADKPYFRGPIPFVRRESRDVIQVSEGRRDHRTPVSRPPIPVPMYRHNHCPSITWCPNGDLLAVWFSTPKEVDREMTILASRLRPGAKQWDLPSEFFKAPGRNMTGSALFHDSQSTIFHFNGMEAAGTWGNLALAMRISTDNGATWSRPRLINAEHQPRNQVISGTSMTGQGWLLQPCDAVHGGSGGTALHISKDGGKTWTDPGAGTKKPNFQKDKSGHTIAGIHAGVVQLRDGSLLAFGRGDNRLGSNDNIGQRMPRSVSKDLGRAWTYSASEFPPIGGGQRLVLMRLREGPLMFASYTDSSRNLKSPRGMELIDAGGKKRRCFGLFAALSFDDGHTWPLRRLITNDSPGATFDGGAWTRGFVMDYTHAEPRGYLAATQTPDGVIHLISSALYYRFNLAWLKTPMPAVPPSRR